MTYYTTRSGKRNALSTLKYYWWACRTSGLHPLVTVQLAGCAAEREASTSPLGPGQLSGTVGRKTPNPSGQEGGGLPTLKPGSAGELGPRHLWKNPDKLTQTVTGSPHDSLWKRIPSMPCDRGETSEVTERRLHEGGLEDLVTWREQREDTFIVSA